MNTNNEAKKKMKEQHHQSNSRMRHSFLKDRDEFRRGRKTLSISDDDDNNNNNNEEDFNKSKKETSESDDSKKICEFEAKDLDMSRRSKPSSARETATTTPQTTRTETTATTRTSVDSGGSSPRMDTRSKNDNSNNNEQDSEDSESEEEDDNSPLPWSLLFLEYRHDPCMMTPISSILLLTIGLLSFLILLFQLPGVVLGFAISHLLRRSPWLVEFLYPSGAARWAHLMLLRWGSHSSSSNGTRGGESSKKKKSKDGKKKDGGKKKAQQYNSNNAPFTHSRSIEQRIEVIPDRIYIHPLPQLLDNVGYVILCLPPPRQQSLHHRTQHPSRRYISDETQKPIPILALVVDCGDGPSVLAQLQRIRDVHYTVQEASYHHANNNSSISMGGLLVYDPIPEIEIHGILSTHKHHDHTAGNKYLLDKCKETLKIVVGGRVERVPFCNTWVGDGEMLEDCLPVSYDDDGDERERRGMMRGRITNDMRDCIEIECVVVPSHTRY